MPAIYGMSNRSLTVFWAPDAASLLAAVLVIMSARRRNFISSGWTERNTAASLRCGITAWQPEYRLLLERRLACRVKSDHQRDLLTINAPFGRDQQVAEGFRQW